MSTNYRSNGFELNTNFGKLEKDASYHLGRMQESIFDKNANIDPFWVVEFEKENGEFYGAKRFDNYEEANKYFEQVKVPKGEKANFDFSSAYTVDNIGVKTSTLKTIVNKIASDNEWEYNKIDDFMDDLINGRELDLDRKILAFESIKTLYGDEAIAKLSRIRETLKEYSEEPSKRLGKTIVNRISEVIDEASEALYASKVRAAIGSGNDEIGKFWVVTAPTDNSTLKDILFESDVLAMANQFKGGLKEDEVLGLFKDEKRAKEFATRLLSKKTAAILDMGGVVVTLKSIHTNETYSEVLALLRDFDIRYKEICRKTEQPNITCLTIEVADQSLDNLEKMVKEKYEPLSKYEIEINDKVSNEE